MGGVGCYKHTYMGVFTEFINHPPKLDPNSPTYAEDLSSGSWVWSQGACASSSFVSVATAALGRGWLGCLPRSRQRPGMILA